MDLDLVVFLKDGKYRLDALKLLNKNSLISSELALELNINRASMSRILKDLKEKDLVLSNSNNSRTVIYSISQKGKSILEELE